MITKKRQDPQMIFFTTHDKRIEDIATKKIYL